MLATATELAGYMQQDLDTNSATQALTLASGMFEDEADTKFSVTSATYTVEGYGQQQISLPRRPVVAIQSVTVGGAAVSDYQAIGGELYRLVRWGGFSTYASPVVVTYTYGYAAPPDDVKLAVLFMAAQLYDNPQGLSQMQVGGYSEQRSVNQIVVDWRRIASKYRIGAVA